MNHLQEAYRQRVRARSLCLIARSRKASARETVATSRVIRHKNKALLQRLHALRLHGPLPKESV
jgi:hypothetical protein